MQFYTVAFALLSAALVVRANPVAQTTQKCNADYSASSCGACHYWRQCLDSRTNNWIVPCAACDNTSWCKCDAPAGQNGF